MVRFDACMLMVALEASLVSCGSGAHQPEPPAVVPSPASQPQLTPVNPSAPKPKDDPKADPKVAPKDSGNSVYPWQSAPIADL